MSQQQKSKIDTYRQLKCKVDKLKHKVDTMQSALYKTRDLLCATSSNMKKLEDDIGDILALMYDETDYDEDILEYDRTHDKDGRPYRYCPQIRALRHQLDDMLHYISNEPSINRDYLQRKINDMCGYEISRIVNKQHQPQIMQLHTTSINTIIELIQKVGYHIDINHCNDIEDTELQHMLHELQRAIYYY